MKILIANRGEIAVRVIRACREMGLPTVAVYSDCDRAARHVREADQAFHLGANEAARSYLNIEAILDVARRSGADAVHPGYGFLAENAAFARACRDGGLTFIGPSPEAIALMGSKTAARAVAIRAGVPVVPGTDQPFAASATEPEIVAAATRIGYPLVVKAVAGGGGKGMRVVAEPAELMAAIRTARSEAGAAFGDSSVYLERRLARPRHVEIQLLADRFGTVVPFVERECSIQRRHQKVVEESPSIAVSVGLRHKMAAAAAAVARAAEYTNAGTIEFLLDFPLDGGDGDGSFYFLEMNTRLQVEHPVTEMVTGLDLVHWQIRIARGERLDIDEHRALTPVGHAIECRIYAEDPDQGFLPAPGRIRGLRPAAGPGIRDDSGVDAGYDVPVYYDSMIAKLVAWDGSREAAIARMSRALAEYQVLGIRTTIPFFVWLMRQPPYRDGQYDTTWLDRLMTERAERAERAGRAGRGGASFNELNDDDRRLVTIAAAIDAHLRARPGAETVTGQGRDQSLWQQAARIEALRV